MKIAFMGTRGVPASYSGFETFVDELGSRLAKRGHEVTVYNRTTHVKYDGRVYKGMRLVPLPTVPSKHLDTIAHTFLSVLHGLFQSYDIVYFCGVGNSPLTFIPRIFGTPTVLNVDGADWAREKWGALASIYLKLAERIAVSFPSLVISDSVAVQEYYRRHFSADSVFIPYGSEVIREDGDEHLKKFGLEKRGYILQVGRLVPENNMHLLIQAYKKARPKKKLVIVGDAPYTDEYKDELKKLAGGDPGIIFTGYLFGRGYRELQSNSYMFVLASKVGGTHPVLVEAMGAGNCVLAYDTPADREVLGDAGIIFNGESGPDGLAGIISRLDANPEEAGKYRPRAVERVREKYSWEAVTAAYEDLFRKMTG